MSDINDRLYDALTELESGPKAIRTDLVNIINSSYACLVLKSGMIYVEATPRGLNVLEKAKRIRSCSHKFKYTGEIHGSLSSVYECRNCSEIDFR